MKKSFLSVIMIVLAAVALTANAQFGARPGSETDATPPAEHEGSGNTEDFADISLLSGQGWILDNRSNPLGTTDWFQGNPVVFSAHAGASDAYIGANFNNTTGGTGQICNWLVMPDLGTVNEMAFWTRTAAGSIWPDRLRVLYSPTGGTARGNCSGGFGDFTTELLVINGGLGLNYPTSWTEFTVNPGGNGRIAFVYDVPNGGPSGDNSNYIGIDSVSWDGLGDGPARFLVTKSFNDGNDAEVEVTLTCNTGLPLSQPADISAGDPVNFVITDFEPGTLNCTVTETEGPDGYSTSYDDGTISSTNCAWEGIGGGQYFCDISNNLNTVEVEVTKVWIDENPQFNAQNIASAEWDCSNVAFGSDTGLVQFDGNPDSDSFFVYPDWDTGTNCSITEVNLGESGVEVDDTDCQGITLWPGVDSSCTIYNTRLYEGIPTLSQYGLALMALLMLGIGFVAFRRFS